MKTKIIIDKTGFNEAWNKIFDKYEIYKHNFKRGLFPLTASMIKEATKNYITTRQREPRLLCKQDTRENRPHVFIDNNLFILPIKNGEYAILEGEGYVDIPKIEEVEIKSYKSKLNFDLETSKIGNSEMQYLDFAYASSLIRTFLQDNSLILTIRGRKYTPKFEFYAGKYKQSIKVKSVQTEVDAGYEGKNQIVLIEAKISKAKNIIIRQLYYPFRQWKTYIKKEVNTIFFEKKSEKGQNTYSFWKFWFREVDNYNSIEFIQKSKFIINA